MRDVGRRRDGVLRFWSFEKKTEAGHDQITRPIRCCDAPRWSERAGWLCGGEMRSVHIVFARSRWTHLQRALLLLCFFIIIFLLFHRDGWIFLAGGRHSLYLVTCKYCVWHFLTLLLLFVWSIEANRITRTLWPILLDSDGRLPGYVPCANYAHFHALWVE